jgi:hypothetical protein
MGSAVSTKSFIATVVALSSVLGWSERAAALVLSATDAAVAADHNQAAVAVEADDATGIAGGYLEITYDANGLVARRVQVAELLSSVGMMVASNLAVEGRVALSMASATAIPSGGGALVTLFFDVKQYAVRGKYVIALRATLWDQAGAILPAQIMNGTLDTGDAETKGAGVELSPPLLEFPATAVGSTSRQVLEVANPAFAPLGIRSISVVGADAAHFQVSPQWFTIAPQGRRTTTVTFVPSTSGQKSALLSVAYEGLGSPATASLSGQALPVRGLGLSTSVLEFSPTRLRSVSRKTVAATNTSRVALKVVGLAVRGPDASQFRVLSTGFVLQPNQKRMVAVEFVPTAAGTAKALLTVTHNHPGSPGTVELVGEAVEPQPARLLVTAGSAVGAPGDTVRVAVAASDARGIAGGELVLEYDPARLEAVEVRPTDLLTKSGIMAIYALNPAGKARIALAGATGIRQGKGPLVVLSFVVLGRAAPGACTLRLAGRLWEESGTELPAIFADGEVTVEAAAAKPSRNDQTALRAPGVSNSPNPFNSATVIGYQVGQTQRVRIAVYNLLGQRIRQLADQVEDAGWHQTRWDGVDESGIPVRSGVYLCLVEKGGMRQVHPMLLLR